MGEEWKDDSCLVVQRGSKMVGQDSGRADTTAGGAILCDGGPQRVDGLGRVVRSRDVDTERERLRQSKILIVA